MPKHYQTENTIIADMSDLIRDVSLIVTPIEFCELISGNAKPETILLAQKLIKVKYRGLSNFNSAAQISNLFSTVGSTIDPGICEKLLNFMDDFEPQQRTPSTDYCFGNNLARRYLLADRVNKEEMQDLLTRVAKSRVNKTKQLMRVVNSATSGGEALLDLIPDPFVGPGNPNGVVDRDPPSMEHLSKFVATSMLDPIRTKFYTEINSHISSLFRQNEDGQVIFADGYANKIGTSDLVHFFGSNLNSENEINYSKLFYLNIPERGRTPIGGAEILPFTAAPSDFEFFEQIRVNYGIFFKGTDTNWTKVRDFYQIRGTDISEIASDVSNLRDRRRLRLGQDPKPKDKDVFSLAGNSIVDEDISLFLSSMGNTDPSIPGPVKAWDNILKQRWSLGLTALDDEIDVIGNFHKRFIFPKLSAEIIEGISLLTRDLPKNIDERAIVNMFRHEPDKLRRILSRIRLFPDTKFNPQEEGIVDFSSFQKQVATSRQSSTESDHSKRYTKSFSDALIQLYLRVIVTKITLEAMFVFSTFNPKGIFSSEAFTKYFLKTLIREVRKTDRRFLGKILNNLRTQAVASVNSDKTLFDPLTGEEVSLSVSLHSSREEEPLPSPDFDISQQEQFVGNFDLRDIDRVVTLLSDENGNSNPCDEELPETVFGLLGINLQDDDIDLEIALPKKIKNIGYFEYFAKKQFAEAAQDIDRILKPSVGKESTNVKYFIENFLKLVDVPASTSLKSDLRFFNKVSWDSSSPIPSQQDPIDIQQELVELNNQGAPGIAPRGLTLRANSVKDQILFYLKSKLFILESEESLIKDEYKYLLDGNFILERYIKVEDFEIGSEREQEILTNEPQAHQLIFGQDRPGDTKGVVNIRVWQQHIQTLFEESESPNGSYYRAFNELFVKESNKYRVNLFRYFKDVKYGIRINYVYPLTQNKQYKAVRGSLMAGSLSQFAFEESAPMNVEESAFESFSDFILNLPQVEGDRFKKIIQDKKAYILEEAIGFDTGQDIKYGRVGSDQHFFLDTTVGRRGDRNVRHTEVYTIEEFLTAAKVSPSEFYRTLKIFSVPLVEAEQTIDPRKLDRNISDVRSLGIFDWSVHFRENYLGRLKGQLYKKPAFKSIFEYIFPVERFLSLFTIYSAEYISGLVGREDFLQETQKMIISAYNIVENSAKEDWWKTPPSDGNGTAIQEEQVGVPKDQLKVLAPLKMIEGLISVSPPIKHWFKLPDTDRGLFEISANMIRTGVQAAAVLTGAPLPSDPASTTAAALANRAAILAEKASVLDELNPSEVAEIMGLKVDKSKKMPPMPEKEGKTKNALDAPGTSTDEEPLGLPGRSSDE
jgi:hypothetical protein